MHHLFRGQRPPDLKMLAHCLPRLLAAVALQVPRVSQVQAKAQAKSIKGSLKQLVISKIKIIHTMGLGLPFFWINILQ